MANSFPAMQAVMNTLPGPAGAAWICPGLYSGLLLHPAAPEWDFDPWRLSPRTASRPGLHTGAWLDDDTAVQRFRARIFAAVALGKEAFQKSFPD
jgi:AMMECR1 domain-containing protein